MFAWLDRTISNAVPARCLCVTPHAFARWLPLLGSVLYVAGRQFGDTSGRLSRGVLSDSAMLMPLLHTSQLQGFSRVGADGPREWIDCLETHGDLLARLHLLPDTDYLAWDDAPGTAIAANEALPFRRMRSLRATQTHLLSFRCRTIATLTCLSEAPMPELSRLSRTIARSIAGTQPIFIRGEPMAM